MNDGGEEHHVAPVENTPLPCMSEAVRHHGIQTTGDLFSQCQRKGLSGREDIQGKQC